MNSSERGSSTKGGDGSARGDDRGNISADGPGFVHRYLPPGGQAGETGDLTLLLLHGTGGDEEDLIPVGEMLLPGAGILSPRGRVVENGMRRFFRRHGVGLLDQEDLRFRTDELVEFIDQAAISYGFSRDNVVAAGFSNGANIATSVLLRRGPALRAAILLSPMLPFVPDEMPDLAGVSVFIGAGRADPYAPVEQVEQLATLLEGAGAEVILHWEPGGHTLTRNEVDAAARWIAEVTRGSIGWMPRWSGRQGSRPTSP